VETVLDLIKSGMRKAGILAAGRQPKSSEADDGLDVVQGLYDGWALGGMFGRLTDVLADEDIEAKEGQRIRAETGVTITLPSTVSECGEDDRAPYDLSMIVVVQDGAQQVNIYDAFSGDWVRFDGLTLVDTPPLMHRDRDGLAACVAVAFADEFGGVVGPATQAKAASFRVSLSMRTGNAYRPSQPVFF
jgi:hypothetical protein